MTTRASSIPGLSPEHHAIVPATTWDQLVDLEPGLREIPTAIDLLRPMRGRRDGGLRYGVIRSWVSALVGWERGHHAPDVQRYKEFGHGSGRLYSGADLLAMDDRLTTEPLTEAERWLRTPQAYDLAMAHVLAL